MNHEITVRRAEKEDVRQIAEIRNLSSPPTAMRSWATPGWKRQTRSRRTAK